MQSPESYYHYLINRYFNNSITREELDELLALVRSGEYDDELTAALLQQWEAAGAEKKETGIDWDSKLEAMLQQHRAAVVEMPATRRIKWYRIAAAAVLLLSMGTGIYYILRSGQHKAVATAKGSTLSTDTITLQPGTNGAVLTLADGRKVVLDSAGNGLLAMQGNTMVLNNSGSIRYNEASANTTETIYNTLSTPRGKQFRLELSDGTRVWLNAASSIRFPATFSKDIRKVEITGEVYFEVKSLTPKGEQEKVPFVVKVVTAKGDGGEVRVLGTHFNINAYDDEERIKTTLLEGKVEVVKRQSASARASADKVAKDKDLSVVLKPGEQAVLTGNSRFTIDDSRLTIDHSPNIENVIAWKNGYFSFSGTDLATVMRQIARWYDVDIEYAGAIPDRKFGGEISRNSNATDVLKIMEESEVHFKIAGRKIIVLP